MNQDKPEKLIPAIQDNHDDVMFIPMGTVFRLDDVVYRSLEPFILDDVAASIGVDIDKKFVDMKPAERHSGQMTLASHMISLGIVDARPDLRFTIH